jgi:GNAT superfamily N-acetyltransferase
LIGGIIRTMTAATVRDARSTDAVDLASLSTQLGYPASPESMPDRLARLAGDVNARAIVAESDGGIAGMLTIHLRYTLNHAAPIAQITLLVVNESARGKGVGRALVAEAERWAKSRGSRRINVTTQLSRAGAHAFYESVGYAHTGRRYGKDFT